jgi:hypothetical protein
MNALSHFRIGRGDWLKTIEEFGRSIHPDFWSGFTLASADAIRECEDALNRRLPEDFSEFLRLRGFGPFASRIHGGIDGPQVIVEGCPGPLYMCVRGAHNIQEDQLRRFYCTKGSYNPNPTVLFKGATLFNGVDLLDVIQIGWDGLAGYHQLIESPAKYGFGYLVITGDITMEDRQPDFSTALATILTEIKRRVNESTTSAK